MLVMIRDRVRDLKKKGMTLEQVKAARPTLDFDGRYGSTTGTLDDRHVHRGGVQDSSGEESNAQRATSLLRRSPRRLRGVARRPPTTRSARPTRSASRSSSRGKSSSSSTAIRTRSCTSRRPTPSGVSQRWAVEWGGTAQLATGGRQARHAQGRRQGRHHRRGRRACPASTAC